jgi:hypothetical protein
MIRLGFHSVCGRRTGSGRRSDCPSAWTVVGKKTTPAAIAVMGNAAGYGMLGYVPDRSLDMHTRRRRSLAAIAT